MTPAPKRRWFRYSLRTLFVVVTLFAAILGWSLWNIKKVKEREALLDSLFERGAIVGTGQSDPPPRRLPLGWWLFGAKNWEEFELLDDHYTQADLDALAILFPETKLYHSSREEHENPTNIHGAHPIDQNLSTH